MEFADFKIIVDSALHEVGGNSVLASEILAAYAGPGCYVVGRNDQSAELIREFKVLGVIDDFETESVRWNGVPVLPASSVPESAVIVNCSTSISPVLVSQNLMKIGLSRVISFGELVRVSNHRLSWPWFVAQQREHFSSHAAEWEALYTSLADAESRQTLQDVVRYRMTANPEYMRRYQVRLKNQYLEDFMQYSAEVFVDAGGYDGDTTEEFCRRYPDYSKVFLFEPSARNMRAAHKRLELYRDIIFLEKGLSDQAGVIGFDGDLGSASSVSGDAAETIPVTTLDEEVAEPVSFIKMDLEGWEMKALAGCRDHIVRDRPKLAISVYHSASDFIEIPRFILSLDSGYRIYLRHYTQGWSETIMYFV